MKNKTKIDKQLERKNNPELVRTIIEAKKKDRWFEIASILSSPRIKRTNLNLDKINKETKEGETITIPGKVLSQGKIDKKIKVVALDFSGKAKEKLLNAGCEVSNILDEIKSNPDAKGIRILR